MNFKNLIIFSLLSFIFLNSNVDGQGLNNNYNSNNNNNTCSCFADSKSYKPIGECGKIIEAPCETIEQAVSNCRDNETVVYSTINLYLQDGTYIIEQDDITFGPITNKTINIIGYGTPYINLSNASVPLINFQPSTPWDSNSVYLDSVWFMDGNRTGSVLLNNGTAFINVDVYGCFFRSYNDNDKLSGNLFAFLGSPSNDDDESDEQIIPTVNGTVNFDSSYFNFMDMGDSIGGIFFNNGLNISFSLTYVFFENIKASSIFYSTFTESASLSMHNVDVGSCNALSIFTLQSNVFPDSISPPVYKFISVIAFSTNGTIFQINGTSSTTFEQSEFTGLSYSTPILATRAGELIFDSCEFGVNDFSGLLNTTAGAITALSTSLIVRNTNFSSNVAYNGGVIVMKSDIKNVVGNISNTVFFIDQVDNQGGSIYVENIDFLTVQNVSFLGEPNTLLYCMDSNVTFSNIDVQFHYELLACQMLAFTNCNIKNLDTQENFVCFPKYRLTTNQLIGIGIGIVAASIFITIIIVLIIKKYKKKNNGDYLPIKTIN